MIERIIRPLDELATGNIRRGDNVYLASGGVVVTIVSARNVAPEPPRPPRRKRRPKR